MDENQLLSKLLDSIVSSPSIWVSILIAGVTLKRYVINGTIKTFLLLKEQEVKSMNALESGLRDIIAEQKKLYEKVCNSQ